MSVIENADRIDLLLATISTGFWQMGCYANTIFAPLSYSSNFYALRAILNGIMNNWLIDYHHALQLRLLGLLVIFGVVFPALCLLVAVGRGLAKRLAQGAEYSTRSPQGQLR